MGVKDIAKRDDGGKEARRLVLGAVGMNCWMITPGSWCAD
jgi:hypothetical protein